MTLFITLSCSLDLFLGFPILISPNFVLRLFCSSSRSSKAILPLYILLKMCSGPLKPIKFIVVVLPLKNMLNY